MLEKNVEQLWGDRKFDEITKIAARLVKKEKIDLDPYHLQLIGVSCSIRSRFKLALRFLKEAYEKNPRDPNSVLNYGNCLKDLGDFSGARAVYNEHGFTRVDPQIFSGSLICDLELGDYALAFEKADYGEVRFPSDSRVAYQSARAKFKQEKVNEAYELYKKSLELEPGYEPAALNLAITALKAGDVSLGAHLASQILEHNRGSSDFLRTFMTLAMEKSAPFVGIEAYERASKRHKTPVVKYVAAELCRFTKNHEAALTLCKEVVEADPAHASAFLTIYHTQCGLGLFSESSYALGKFKKLANKPESPIYSLPNPWTAFSALDSAKDQAILAAKYANVELNRLPRAFPALDQSEKDDIPAVGFLSPDFGMHPVTECLIPLLKKLKGKVRLYALSLRNEENEDAMTSIAEGLFDRFFRCSRMSHGEMRDLCQENQIETIIDLAGHTAHGRPVFLALGLARRQISFLGYSGTTGANCYEGVVADGFLIPAHLEKYYSEPVIRLAIPMMSCALRVDEPIEGMQRSAYGLSDAPVLFGCLASSYKYSQKIVDAWAEILKRSGGAELLLADAEATTKENIIEYFSNQGIERKRIHFARREKTREEHLSRLQMVDIFLDSWPYNAHSLAADALTAGVPLITLSSDSFASRVAGSLLSGLGLTDLVTFSISEYIERAVSLAASKELISQKKAELREALNKRDWAEDYAAEFVEKVVLGKS